jgi:hypothetical protein
MSNQSTKSSNSYSYSYSSSSSSSNNGQVTGHRATQQTHTDSSGGTTVTRTTQRLGEPVVQETRSYDSAGQERIIGGNEADNSRRIEDVSDQAERDREYEERMEDE